MTKEDLAYFKQLLEEKQREILEELGYIKDVTENSSEEKFGEDTTYSTHMADHGTDEQEREKRFYHASRENKFLMYIEEALQRIENGTYGICISCGKEIPKERLEAVPHTQKCVPCKLAEKQE
ncbi:MAG: TraR/DksA C4-type zinc finger protein [candidate division KSB1 bacterium]|nr:TraR/DksA C4-type zinc finger protein [candidate division KSB1 bacterium]MDZ7335151.1 TraR/DksA C4-type zinc finger protein [candidate division KSB1 bacterium]MDZ7356834.1 TraR/DksA C4-type zinc finger protein [candidate division KSB1 bacterium]MDZ7401327.1 TraR/DksA C4-type zinc finger protein [candidate division KSB1 bacterium]